jgi:serine/threonine protein phosphatase PrpC
VQHTQVSAIALSEDHKPYREDEKARIEKLGGYVNRKRVLGQLAVSRAFGDVGFKRTSAEQAALQAREGKALEEKGEEKEEKEGGSSLAKALGVSEAGSKEGKEEGGIFSSSDSSGGPAEEKQKEKQKEQETKKAPPKKPSTALVLPADIVVTGPLVSNEPDIVTHDIGPRDEFILLACDGVYDVMSNLDACQFVHRRLTEGADVKEACEDLVDEALCRGSADNVTAVVVRLKHHATEDAGEVASPPLLTVNLMPQLSGGGVAAAGDMGVANRNRNASDPR